MFRFQHTTGCLSPRHRTQSCCVPRRDRRPTVPTAICGNLPKNWPFRHKTSGSLNYPWIGGGDHPQLQIHVFRQFWGISLIKKRHCLGWCPMMTAVFEHLDVRSTSDPVEALQARLDRFLWIFFLRNIQTWNSATPIFKQVFQLDDSELLHEKCMFHQTST